MRARGEVLRQPRQAQVLARVGVVAQDDGVEAPVVLGHERAGTLRVFKHPLGEPLLQGVGFLLRGGGLQRVEHAALLAVDVLDLVVDEQGLLLHDRLGDIGGRATLGAPLVGGQQPLASSPHFPHAWQRVLHVHVAGAQQLVQELRVHVGANPHRAHAGADLFYAECFGYDLGERVDISLERRVVGGALGGVLQLHAHVAGEIRGGVDELVGDRVGEHQPGKRGAGFGFVHAEHVGDQRQVDPAGAVEADRYRIGRGVNALGFGARGDDAACHDRRRGRGLVGVVKLLQGEHERPERVGAQQPDRGRHRAGVGVFPGLVGAAGAAQRVPVQRPVPASILPVVAVQALARLVDLVGVIDGRGLQFEQPVRAVAQPQQGAQLRPRRFRHVQRFDGALDDGAEPGVGGDDAAIPQLRRRRHTRGLPCLILRRGRSEDPSGAAGCERDLVEHIGQVGLQAVEVAIDGERRGAVHALPDAQGAEHMLGVVIEVGVDLRALSVQADRGDRFPQVICRGLPVLAAVQDEQIGHHVGSRRAPMCPGGEPDRAHEVSEHRHLAARAGVLRVHRVLRREHRDHPAGPGEPQALEDEMVVHRQPRRIVHRVVQGHV